MKKINIIITMLLLSISVISQTTPYVTTTGTQTLTNKTYSNSILSGSVTVNQATTNTIPYFDGSKFLKSATLGGGLNLSSGTLSQTLTSTRVAFGSSTNAITTNSNITVDEAKECLVLGDNGGTSSDNEPASQPPAILELSSNNQNTQALNFKCYGSTPGTQNDIHFYRYDGTPSAPTNTKFNMFLMSVGWRGWGASTATESSFAWQVKASENWTETAHGANMIFQSTPNGKANVSDRRSALMINNDQRIFLTKAHDTYAPYRSNAILNIDLTNATSPGSTLSIGAIMTHSTNGSASLIMGTASGDETFFYHYGSAVAGSFTGTSYSVASVTSLQSGNTTQFPLRLGGSNIALTTGTTSTNTALRVDAVGLRVGANSTVHTANTSTFKDDGSFALAYVAKTGNYTATVNDYLINCTANSFTVTLPTAVGITGRIYEITNSGAGTITIATTSSQTFTNVTATPTTLSLAATLAKSIRVMSNGTNWLQLN